MKIIEGGITAAKGYKVGSVACGIKKKNLDLTVLVSSSLATVAGVFTTNTVKAAPVIWDQNIIEKKKGAFALVVNSGNANACTGKQGLEDAAETAEIVAKQLNCNDNEVLVCSTGVIGYTLPMEKIREGIGFCIEKLESSVKASKESAQAILTTDTFAKEVAVQVEIEGKTVTIAAMSKGSGMIHPNMATMLSFVTTDAKIEQSFFQKLLKEAVQESYNMISIDGDTSTNDTVLAFANGQSQISEITENSPQANIFGEAFKYVNQQMAKKIVLDGEGATKFIEVEVTGAESNEDAKLMARSIISSNLVKTAFFGSDANWGRIICAMGYSKASFNPNDVSITYMSNKGLIVVLQEGLPVTFDESLAKKILKEDEIKVKIVAGTKEGKAVAWGCDLSYEYVKINGDYRS
ncbi:MAG: bifunctional ornithine acetyltransferase/N-acetylglutamate synthase [Sphaerochaetaceae bacterium]